MIVALELAPIFGVARIARGLEILAVVLLPGVEVTYKIHLMSVGSGSSHIISVTDGSQSTLPEHIFFW